MSVKYADRTKEMQASEIRESYKLMDIPGMISLSSGSPDPELYPIEEFKQAQMRVMDEMGRSALAYGQTDGWDPLRDKIVERMKRKCGVECSRNNIIIMSGSQQVLDFAARIFINDGDTIACETPSYMGAFNAFTPCRPKYADIATDRDGMLPEALDEALSENPSIKMIYVIPNFQNPTGHQWSLERRIAFMKVINKYNVPVLEDDPYGELIYEGESLPTLKSMDTKGLVVYAGSFSKILAPGLRVAWICAEEEMAEKFMFAKQGADLQTSQLAMMDVDKYMEMYDLDKHVQEIIKCYRQKRDLMDALMHEYFPQSVTWEKPKGGLFIWVTLPDNVDSREVLDVCLKNKVMFVTGSMFYPNGGINNTLRLNFSWMKEADIIEGITRMGTALHEAIDKQ
ncbi:MAG: PLP-dependent aminotransferase family protein [Eubacteriaceae bacterium]|jgi:2-aminoadipate transaminase|nr:PLP-dependent aminotransferase family protein [Eubacteriaceae bacterium]